jgi:type VI secretion system protein ImpG
MHPRLLHLYNQELGHVREMAAEFAREFPKVASRLTLDGMEVADPYVERLLEGFAFLAARVQLKLEAEFPNFIQHLLEVVYPNLAAPTPSMAIVRLVPDMSEPGLLRGVPIARGTTMKSLHLRGSQTACEFRTAHAVTLWPLELSAVQYFSFAPDLPMAQVPELARAKGCLRLRLRAPAGVKLSEVRADSLVFFICAPDDPANRLVELVLGSGMGVLTMPADKSEPLYHWTSRGGVHPVGFEDDQCLLPATRPGFRGYRLLQEYAAMPQRFLFFEVRGLQSSLRRCAGAEMDIVLPFSRGDAGLESLIDSDSVALHCTPVVNLFRKRVDRIDISDGRFEFQVVADRMRPVDFEVRDVESVVAYGAPPIGEQAFKPLYAAFHHEGADERAYFSVKREPRLLPSKSRAEGARSSYVGSEVYLALVDRDETSFEGDLRQVAVEAWCTNRDLPLLLPAGGMLPAERNDFEASGTTAVRRIQCLRGPSAPRGIVLEGRRAWTLISQLNLNYLSLLDTREADGVAALRAILMLYCDQTDASLRRQVEGIRAVSSRRVARRIDAKGPLAFASGIEVTLTLDELAFQGGSAFLLGRVLEVFFSRHAAINSFVELSLRSTGRGEIMRTVPMAGTRPLL